MDSHIVLDFLLAIHGGICTIANTCAWINKNRLGEIGYELP